MRKRPLLLGQRSSALLTLVVWRKGILSSRYARLKGAKAYSSQQTRSMLT